ncbi:MAG: DUF3106 domain-containing protein [Gammaproteobacteria bacterium]|nr:DUF3106 domain-containing protein [Gammaproteobacteria bacterium]MDH5514621.1 DUF3106 domain-containing protein [Gammaproteobacteria bacterium]
MKTERTTAVPDMTLRTTTIALLLGCLAMASAVPALADNRVDWQNLSDGEQEMLKKYRRNWSTLDQDEQSRLRQGARNYMNLPPDKREAVRRKRDEYKKMPPEERERLRRQYRQRR